MDLYVILLRIIHIFAGVFWVGAFTFFIFFIEPTATALGPQAQKFMSYLTEQRRYPSVFGAATGLNVLAGLLLYLHDFGFNLAGITTQGGLGFTLGAIAALIAFVLGATIVRANAERLGKLGAELAAGGGPPSPDKLAELRKVQHALRQFGMYTLGLLVIALLGMATARYLPF